MARVRQARKCHARRTDGEPCNAFAIIGGDICRVHGGASPKVKFRALYRAAEAAIWREFEAEHARWQREWSAWHAERVAVTAELLGLPPGDVTPFAIGICRGLYGRPDGPETEPKMRRDHRFRPRQRATA